MKPSDFDNIRWKHDIQSYENGRLLLDIILRAIKRHETSNQSIPKWLMDQLERCKGRVNEIVDRYPQAKLERIP